jgi:O-antigen ligase
MKPRVRPRNRYTQRMTALIVVIAIALLVLAFTVGVRPVMLAIVLLRPLGDQFFEYLKGVSDSSAGPGASINIVILAGGFTALLTAPRLLTSPVLLAMILFLGAAALSMLHGPDPGGGVRMFLTLATYVSVFALGRSIVRSSADVEQALRIAVYSSLGPNLIAICGILTNSLVYSPDGRLQGTFTHPNIYAFFLMTSIAGNLFLLSSSRVTISSRFRLELNCLTALCLALLALTQTRSAWIAVSLILLTYAITIDRRWLALVALAPFALLVPVVGDRISDLGAGNVAGGYAQLNSYAWRELLWSDALQWMRQNPQLLLGNGLDLFESLTPLFFTPGGPEGVMPHNAFLQIYFEMGIVGLTTYGAIFFALAFELGRGWKVDWRGTLLMGLLCIGYLTVSYSDNVLDYLQYQWLFWFTLATVTTYPGMRRAQNAQQYLNGRSDWERGYQTMQGGVSRTLNPPPR